MSNHIEGHLSDCAARWGTKCTCGAPNKAEDLQPWAVGSNTHSLQHVTYGGGTFVIRSADQVYIGDGSAWEPATATEVYDYFVKIDRDAKTRFANMTLWQRLKRAFKGEMS